MKLREIENYQIGVSVGQGEEAMTCRQAVKLALDLLKMVVAISDRADPHPYPPLQTFEFETVTIAQPTSEAAAEIAELVGEGRSIG